MRVLVLRVECGESGESEVTVDVKCKTPEQVDDIIGWLKLVHASGLLFHKKNKTIVIRQTTVAGSDVPASAQPRNKPLLIGRPDVVLSDCDCKRALPVLGIDEADKGGW